MSEAAAMNNNPSVSAIVPAKRKRGRPRKHPKPDPYHVGTYDAPRDQYVSRGYNLNRQENYNGQSGGINGSQPSQQNSNSVNGVMLGQPVHGVIEAVFDAGYLLSVRVGNSDTYLKGVVFKPGSYIPVSAENDIAPGVQMIARNEFPIPSQDNAHIRRRRYRTREKYGTAPLMPHTASPGIPRGNVVPVVLQPVTPSNGVMPSSVAMAPHLAAASKGKAAVDVSVPRSGSSFVQQLEEAEKQAKLQESEPMNQQLVPPGVAQPQPDLNSNSSTEPPASMQIPDDDEEDDYEEDDDEEEEEEDDDDDDDDDDSDQPLTIEPLQAIQPNLNTRPAVNMENYRSGKMTELLQKNVMGNQGGNSTMSGSA
ncbi:Protein METABOLIC NETWORK MODULATOR 1 [Linum grandiflorum]